MDRNNVDFLFQTFDVFDKDGTFIWAYYYTLHIIGAQFMLNLVLGVLSGYVNRYFNREFVFLIQSQ